MFLLSPSFKTYSKNISESYPLTFFFFLSHSHLLYHNHRAKAKAEGLARLQGLHQDVQAIRSSYCQLQDGCALPLGDTAGRMRQALENVEEKLKAQVS